MRIAILLAAVALGGCASTGMRPVGSTLEHEVQPKPLPVTQARGRLQSARVFAAPVVVWPEDARHCRAVCHAASSSP